MIFGKRNKWGVLLMGLAIFVASQLQSLDIGARRIRATQPALGRRRSTGMLQKDLATQANKKKEIEEKVKEIESSLPSGEWFVYQEGTAQGIVIPEQTLRVSGVMNHLLNYASNADKGAVPIAVSMENIPYIFDVLANYENNKNDRFGFLAHVKNEITSISLDRLIDIVNKCNYLDVPEDLLFIFVWQISALIQKMNFDDLLDSGASNHLNIDIRKKIVRPKIKLVIDCLKKEKDKKVRTTFLPKELMSYHDAVLSPDSTKVIFIGKKDLVVWDIETRKIVQKIAMPEIARPGEHQFSVACSSDNTKIVTGGIKSLILWDVKDGKQIHNFSGYDENISAVAFSLDGTKVVAGGHTDVAVWDVTVGTQICDFVDYVPNNKYQTSVDISPSGNIIAVALDGVALGRQGEVILYDSTTGLRVNTFKLELINNITLVRFSPDGTHILVAGRGKTSLVLIDVKTGEQYSYDSKNIFNDTGWVNHAAFSPNGEKIIIADLLQGLILVDMKSGAVSNLGYTKIVNRVGFSQNGTKIVAIHFGNNSSIITCDLLTEQESKILDSLYNCDLATALLLYRLCLASKGKITTLSDSERDIFNSLPELVKSLLADFIK